jgi:hypothetical protein
VAVYFLGLDLFGTAAPTATGYGAPAETYGAPATYQEPAATYDAPAASYDAPAQGYSASAAGRYYDTYDANQANAYDDAEGRKKRSAF